LLHLKNLLLTPVILRQEALPGTRQTTSFEKSWESVAMSPDRNASRVRRMIVRFGCSVIQTLPFPECGTEHCPALDPWVRSTLGDRLRGSDVCSRPRAPTRCGRHRFRALLTVLGLCPHRAQIRAELAQLPVTCSLAPPESPRTPWYRYSREGAFRRHPTESSPPSRGLPVSVRREV